MYTVRENDLYIGYRFKVHAILKDGSMKLIPPENILWQTCGTIQVKDGVVTYPGDKGDRVIAKIINKKHQIIASDDIYISDENDNFDDWEFGITGLDNPDDSKLRRVKDSKNRDYVINMATGQIVTDFDGVIDFLRVKDLYDNEFVKIPTLYRKFDGKTLLISKYKKDKDYKVYPCFISPQDGGILEEIAIGCYKASIDKDGHLISRSKTKRIKGTLDSLKEKIYPFNKYNYYFLRNEGVNQLLRDLFVIIFASRSLSNIFKNQSCVNPLNTETGISDLMTDLMFSYPLNCCYYNYEKKSFKFYGIEDPFDGGIEWIDNMYAVPELSNENSACYLINPLRDKDEENKPEDFVQTNFNSKNIKQLEKVELRSGVYLLPSELTRSVEKYYSNSIFNIDFEHQGRNIISGIPSYIDKPKKTGLWTYFSVGGDEEAYTRLCYCERSEGDQR